MVGFSDSLGEKNAIVQPGEQREGLCSFLMALKISMGWWFSHSVFHSAALEKPAVGVLSPSQVEASLTSIQKLAIRQVGKGACKLPAASQHSSDE